MYKLDDIVPPSRRKEAEPLSPIVSNQESLRFSSRKPQFPYTTIGVVLLIIALSIGALFYFSSAQVEIVPNTVSAAVQGSFTASQSPNGLPYMLISTQKIAMQSVPGSGTETVHSFASGNITIYNTQARSQRLITKTRFATVAGLIFRIHSAVVIPAGSPTNPGRVTVKVYADQAGDSYNVGPTSFTVPGLAGTPQASEIYARSSSMMTGGASGSVPIVGTAIDAQTRQALIAALAPNLTESIQNQVPSNYLLLPGAATTTYQELSPISASTTGMVDIREQGTITAVVFPNAMLAKTIATSIANLNYQGEPLTLASTSNLLLTGESALPNSNTSTFSFTLSGTASLVYTVNASRIATAVAGETSSAAETTLGSYPEVKRAVIILRPFWRQTFPQDPTSILVTVISS